MKNIRKINAVIHFTGLLFFSFVILQSCDRENPIVPPPPNPIIIDSNFFECQTITFNNYSPSYYQFYVADTNRIFISGGSYGIFYDNGTVRQIPYKQSFPTFGPICVNGTSINDVYFGGVAGDLFRSSRLLHWNGNNISDIQLPKDSSSGIYNIEIVSNNDIWFSTDHNIIYHYYNSNIISYKLDSGLYGGTVHSDLYGNLYASYVKKISNEPRIIIFNFLKFENNKWKIIEKDTITSSTEIQSAIRKINSDIIRTGLNGLYYYSGSGWQKFVNIGGLISPIYGLAGENRNNLLFSGFEELVGYAAYFYDGKQLYRQLVGYLYSFIPHIIYKFDKYYLISPGDYPEYTTYFTIATFKKTNSENLNLKRNENKNNNIISNINNE